MEKNVTSTERTDGYGYMIVRVTTARGAIPLEGAIVSVNNYDPEFEGGRGDVIAVYNSGQSGLTERFPLPAPPRSLSMSPGNGKSYETYNLNVTYPGYYQKFYVNVPVFEGITAIQNVDMIPLPENGQIDRATIEDNIFFETENHALESGSGTVEREG